MYQEYVISAIFEKSLSKVQVVARGLRLMVEAFCDC